MAQTADTALSHSATVRLHPTARLTLGTTFYQSAVASIAPSCTISEVSDIEEYPDLEI